MPSMLPPDAYERAREIAESAPLVSDAKRGRLQMIAWGSQFALAAESAPALGEAEAA